MYMYRYVQCFSARRLTGTGNFGRLYMYLLPVQMYSNSLFCDRLYSVPVRATRLYVVDLDVYVDLDF